MAALTTALQLLVLGALVSPVYLLTDCERIKNTTQLGSYTVSVSPTLYKTNTTYNVTISRATSNISVILQALNSQNASVGQWAGPSENCSSEQVIYKQNITDNTIVQWTSPNNGTGPVEIRVFVTFSNGTTQLQTAMLNAEPTTPPTSTKLSTITSTTPYSSVSTTQASSFLVAVVHLLSVLVTGKLFS